MRARQGPATKAHLNTLWIVCSKPHTESSSAIEYAHGYGQRRVAQASITAIPFAAATFELVTALDVLYGLSEAEEAAALAEIHRILRPAP